MAPRGRREPVDYRQVKVPASLMGAVDQAVNEGTWGYRSPAEFVVEAIRRRLEELGLLPGRKND